VPVAPISSRTCASRASTCPAFGLAWWKARMNSSASPWIDCLLERGRGAELSDTSRRAVTSVNIGPGQAQLDYLEVYRVIVENYRLLTRNRSIHPRQYY
jgi:hypothetical protein